MKNSRKDTLLLAAGVLGAFGAGLAAGRRIARTAPATHANRDDGLPRASLLDTLTDVGAGCIAFSPLAQGMLTDRYLDGIPAGSRAAQGKSLEQETITPEVIERVRQLNDLAQGRGQTLAQMALAWVLRDSRVTSTLIGASSVSQLEDNVAATKNLGFSDDELTRIDELAAAA